MQTRFLRAQLGYDDGHFPGVARDVRNSGFYVYAGVVSHSSPSELSSHQMAPPGVIAHSSPSELSSHQMAPPRSRPALEPIRAELISNGSCRDGRSTRDCPPPRRSRSQGLHFGCRAVYCGFLILHVFSMAVQPLRLWGRRRASSACLSSASSAQRLTPSHPRDGVAGQAGTVTPQGLPPRGSPPSLVLIPSTSTSSLSWTGSSCRHSPSCAGTAVRGYVDTVSFFGKGLEVKGLVSDSLNGGFAPPGFF